MPLSHLPLATLLRRSPLGLAVLGTAVLGFGLTCMADPLDKAVAGIRDLKGVATISPVVANDRMFVGINKVDEASQVGTMACQEVRRAGVTQPYRIILIDGVKASAGGDWQLLAEAECPARFAPK